jgi:type IV secretion system protein VirB8
MSAVLKPGRAAALPDRDHDRKRDHNHDHDSGDATAPNTMDAAATSNTAWELDRTLMLERSERRAWWVAIAGLVLGLIGIAAVFVQGPLRRVVEIPIVVDRATGEVTIQQRLSEETIPPMEALDKHNLATFVRSREGYNWMFLQRDFDQVARMTIPAVFTDYNRMFEGDSALHKRLGATEDWRINIVGVRLAASGRSGNRGEATVTYDKVVRLVERNLPEVTTRHVASVVFQYQPKVLAKERDRIENPFASSSPRIGPTPRSIPPCPGASHERAHRMQRMGRTGGCRPRCARNRC